VSTAALDLDLDLALVRQPTALRQALPEPRRILVWSPNYAPELTGIPPLVTDACEWLAGRGHCVDVVTAMPNYPHRRIDDDYRGALWSSEQNAGVSLYRSWLRVRPEETFLDKALYEFSFAACSLPRVARRLSSADVLLCVVPSLLSASAAAAIRALLPAKQRPRLVLWVQDLVLSGALTLDDLGSRGRRALSAAGRLETAAARAADRIVVCSPEFGHYFTARGVQTEKIETIYNWVDVDWIEPSPPPEHPRTRFLYAGNLGYSQGFDTLVDGAIGAGRDVELDIVGDGNAAAEVRRLSAQSERIRVLPPVPRDEFPGLLASADAHVVVQRGVSAGANFPSKISSYLASGRPIVASIDPGTAAARLLRASGGALVVPPDSPRDLARAMRTLSGDAELRAELGRNGRRYAVEHLAKRPMLERLEQELIG
jgi:colanic acid biosynthesis glycosyl transferase WcaI